ncbi:hypothetical protein JAAARDRAFT_702442 [Jaapia argillacea MUCL 33604]|uniref:Uncharacterized protein n=1 Tax=Jaapia argillacea MUCL 33604 TaxID=933084 RepID=A0A067PMQ6_9AGAM|nr:hypothetical protein JAAARDRAFT_702442 [Jaapia argillacea MUCL 33604]
MCLGQNSAHHAVQYLNAQLSVLWENALECIAHNSHGLKPLERVRYDFALAEYHFGAQQSSDVAQQDDVMFRAVFDKPRLEFVCNHEAILYLKIKEGHFNREFTKSEEPAFWPSRDQNVEVKDLELAFRMDFSVSGIRGHSTKIGNGVHVIQLMVLDFSTANLVSKVDIAEGRDSLKYYSTKYLEFLHQAGHHVLFSLPDFDDNRLALKIDYSLDSHNVRNAESEVSEVWGISIAEINESLASKWLKAAILAEDMERGLIEMDHKAICLAEYRSIWVEKAGESASDVQFHIKCGAPKVKALCNKEVFLCFKIDEFLLYDGEDFTVPAKHTYSDWEIVFVVDIVHQKEEEGVVNLKLDMTSAYQCNLTQCGFELSEEAGVNYKTHLLKFIQDHYLTLLESSSFNVFYHIDTRLPALPVTPSRPSTGSSDTESINTHVDDKRRSAWKGIIERSDMHGFDFVQAISPASITEHFKTLWKNAHTSTDDHIKCLREWSYDEYFKATFGVLSLRLLSNGKAVVWVQLEEGHLKTLRNWLLWSEAKERHFKNWRLAFEVDLKMVDHDEVASSSESWLMRFLDSLLGKKHYVVPTFICEQTTHAKVTPPDAEFLYDLSSFEGLMLGGRSALGRVKSAVHYIREHYFHHLTYHGHHILHSIPVWKADSRPPAMGLTDVTYQVYSKHIQNRYNCRHTSKSSEAIIVVLGMINFQPLPSERLAYSTEWIVKNRGGFSPGTVCLSKKIFLEDRLLAILSKVNAETTIVPVFPDAEEDGEWQMELTTWGKRRKNRVCKWEQVKDCESGMDFKWDHTDKWSHEHQGSVDDKNNGTYTVACQTKNVLHFPPTSKHGLLDIAVSGEVSVILAFKGTTKTWSTKTSGVWAATLSMSSSHSSGMTFSVTGDLHPKYETTHVHQESIHPKYKGLRSMLEAQLPHQVDLRELSTELRQSFGGVWEHCFPGLQAYSLCNPVFNHNSDLRFELRPYTPSSATLSPPPIGRPRSSTRSVSRSSDASIASDASATSSTPSKSGKSKTCMSFTSFSLRLG